jgi:hypothetical protein
LAFTKPPNKYIILEISVEGGGLAKRFAWFRRRILKGGPGAPSHGILKAGTISRRDAEALRRISWHLGG